MSIEKNDGSYLQHVGGGWTTIINETILLITDAAALGIYVYLASKPADWIVREKELMAHFSLGRDSINKKLSILRKLGLYEKVSNRDSSGKIIKWVSNLYRTPKPVETQNTEIQDCGEINESQNTENPQSGLATIWQTNIHTKERINTKERSLKTLSLAKISIDEWGAPKEVQEKVMNSCTLSPDDLTFEHRKFYNHYNDNQLRTLNEWDNLYLKWMCQAEQYLNNKRKRA